MIFNNNVALCVPRFCYFCITIYTKLLYEFY